MGEAAEGDAPGSVTVSVLGPLRVERDGQPVALAPRLVTLLLALLAAGGAVVPAARLVALLWGEPAPDAAPATLRSHVARLRRALGSGALIRAAGAGPTGGYRLDLDPGCVDAVRFTASVADGEAALAAGDLEGAVARFAAALDLWRGPAYADVADLPFALPETARLAASRQAARVAWARGLCALGRYGAAAADLASAVAEDPYDETLRRLLALARYGEGRVDEAAVVCRDGIALLGERGLDAPALHGLLRDILRRDVAGAPPADSAPAPGFPVRVPAMLPPDVADFTGRTGDVGALEEFLTGGHAGGAPPTAPAVAVVTGMGGIGKSTLAVHVAHRVAAAFPDGQLYADLRGADDTPAPAADVLALFLRSMGMPGRAVPAGDAECAAADRTLVAGRRLLVVLDNAAAEEQVRPLLPGGAGCGVLVTSRDRLTGLAGTHRTQLDVFTPAAAVRLLSLTAGGDRVAAQPEQAARIVALCGGLPLAVRIAGARLAARPAWRLGDLTRVLHDERRRLDHLATGDLEVRASLNLSYRGLAEQARRLLRRLSGFAVPHFPHWLAAAVLERPPDEATTHLEQLVDAQLLTAAGVDAAGQLRYRFHDLVRLFARERLAAEETAQVAAESRARGFGAWLAMAGAAAAQVPGPFYAPVAGAAPRYLPAGVPLPQGPVEAASWFDAESAALLAAIRQACGLGLDELAFDLAGCLEKYFDLRGRYQDWTRVNTGVMHLCQRTGNLLGEAVMLRGLVDVATWINHGAEADTMPRTRADARRLLEMFTALGHRAGMSDAAVMGSWTSTAAGDGAEAVALASQALQLARACGHPGGEVRAHLALAAAHHQQGRPALTAEHADGALQRASALDNPRAEGTVLQFAGIAQRELGNAAASRALLARSLQISRACGDTYTEVFTLLSWARLHLPADPAEARAAATTAMRLSRAHAMQHHLADALELLGELELLAGRPRPASTWLAEAVALWRAGGWPARQAAALVLLGRAYDDLDPARARRAHREARQILLRLGEPGRAAQVPVPAEHPPGD
ncbi:MAG TPA: BTAD domain-containing putative transcriptional regulator [Pilimelia sp.]|nr:BTAD domain-containing putative transcriptional regulator [Pilimelia sp.]